MKTPQTMTGVERLLFALTLLITAALALTISAHKLMWSDEFLSFYTDSVPTARAVIDVQLHHPISLDPAAYHLLSHFSMGVLGHTATALRLPALAGFLLLQCALFALVQRLAGTRAGIIAMLLPPLTASFHYATEGRPYGLLLGLYASAFTCWFLAAQTEQKRLGYLTGLTLSIALAINSHYFGILILIPIAIAELARVIERKKLDLAMLAAIVLGFASIALILPFQKGLAPYRTYYYINTVSIRAVSQGYRELFVRYTTWPMGLQRLTALLLVVATLGLLVAAVRRYKTRPMNEPASLWAGFAALALLPFFGFLFGRFVTHSMEVRYVIAALLPFIMVIALLSEKFVQGNRRFYALAWVLLLVSIALNMYVARRTELESVETQRTLEFSTPFLEARHHLDGDSDEHGNLYVQTLAEFFQLSYYSPDHEARRAILVYDNDAEVRWLGHNTNAITAANLRTFTNLRIATYPDFLADSSPTLIIFRDSGWQWIAKDIAARHLKTIPLGPTLNGQAFRVQTQP